MRFSVDKKTISLLKTVWVLEFLFGFFNKCFSLGKQGVVSVSCCLSTCSWVQLHRCSLLGFSHLWHHLRGFGAVPPTGQGMQPGSHPQLVHALCSASCSMQRDFPHLLLVLRGDK